MKIFQSVFVIMTCLVGPLFVQAEPIEAQLFFRLRQRINSPTVRYNHNIITAGHTVKASGNRYIVMPFGRLMVHTESGDADVLGSRVGPIRKRVSNRMGGSNF